MAHLLSAMLFQLLLLLCIRRDCYLLGVIVFLRLPRHRSRQRHHLLLILVFPLCLSFFVCLRVSQVRPSLSVWDNYYH